ncbi:carboxypeptidase S [Auriscalpium vulgare]|uniref:Carboxypeptidase S n=1 Tax=Auriscalpium vulgare TaxID=40419 RepID=A0ACB8RC87_9AGAM|nr:carboxypeptidase S [Auriscalpium vulgare]
MADALAVPPDLLLPQSSSALCPQVQPIVPSRHGELLDAIDARLEAEEFRLWAYESLGGAVRIPTETYDDLGPPGEDPRWDTRLVLHDYLEKRFPLIHKTLHKTTVNTYALIYERQGSDASLKPVMLAGHQDVVPVDPDTLDEWIQPPYSGYFDGEWIWGRGSCDDKSGVIAILVAVEALLENGFEPARSVILAFGIDEERGGLYGATAIRDYLLPKYGVNGISILVDEGGGYDDHSGVLFAQPNVAEKGKFDVRIEVTTPGGHSSVPPPHTGVGFLSSLISSLEAEPLPTNLTRTSPYLASLECAAAHDPALDPDLRALIAHARTDDAALRGLHDALLAADPRRFRAITATTQAVDLVGGGVKVNALPESAWAVVDHRIADYSSVDAVQAHYVEVLSPVAAALNLSLDAFGRSSNSSGMSSSAGHVQLSTAFGLAINPAPISPTQGSGPWQLLSGTILSTLASSPRDDVRSKNAVVSPGLTLGGTDTKHYWNLTQHIFRYGHRAASDAYNGAHTTNEAIKAEGYLEGIGFFVRFILNADETDLFD